MVSAKLAVVINDRVAVLGDTAADGSLAVPTGSIEGALPTLIGFMLDSVWRLQCCGSWLPRRCQIPRFRRCQVRRVPRVVDGWFVSEGLAGNGSHADQPGRGQAKAGAPGARLKLCVPQLW